MQKHPWHMRIFAALKQSPKVERIGQAQVDVRVAKTRMKLERQPPAFGYVQCVSDECVVERLGRQANLALASSQLLCRPEGGLNFTVAATCGCSDPCGRR